MPREWDERIWEQLKRIADALERLSELQEIVEPDPPPASDNPCLHPLESRTDFGMTNGIPEWECRICGFRPPT